MKYLPLPLAMLLFWMGACTSFQTHPILRRHNVVIQEVSDADYPDPDSEYRSEVPAPTDFPELDQKKLTALLGSLQFEKKQLWGATRDNVYSQEELPELTALLLEAIRARKDGNRLVIISRFDPDRSVLSRMHRNTLLFWADENGLNLVFGEIHEALPSEHFLSDEDWANILPISLRQPYRDLKLLPADFFAYKTVLGLRHDTWAVVSLDQLEKLRLDTEGEGETDTKDTNKRDKASQESKDKEKQEDTQAQEQSKKNALERLRRLKKAHEEGLITDEEYAKRREAILKDF